MRRVLVVFELESDINKILKSGIYLKECFGFELIPLYIKDIKRTAITSPIGQGMAINCNETYLLQQDELENEKINQIKKALKDRNIENELICEFGFRWDIIKEYLKETDILMFEKERTITEKTLTILKNSYKPIIMVGEKALNSLDNIAISSDDGAKINKSAFEFLNIFSNIKRFILFTIGVKENRLLKYLESKGKEITHINFEGKQAEEEYFEKIKDMDLVVMGNLSRSYLFEKITGRKGITIMEKLNMAVFLI